VVAAVSLVSVGVNEIALVIGWRSVSEVEFSGKSARFSSIVFSPF